MCAYSEAGYNDHHIFWNHRSSQPIFLSFNKVLVKNSKTPEVCLLQDVCLKQAEIQGHKSQISYNMFLLYPGYESHSN